MVKTDQEHVASAEERAKFAAEAAFFDAEAVRSKVKTGLLERIQNRQDLEDRAAAARAEEAETERELSLEVLQQAKQHTRQATLSTERERITTEELERAERMVKAHNYMFQVYVFDHPVMEESVGHCINKLTEWMRTTPGCDIEIVFTSPGGDVIEGLRLFDFLTLLRSRGHKMTIRVLGMAASMAGILLQAGDVRIIGKESVLMIHEISSGVGGKIGEIEDEAKFCKMLCERFVNIFCDRGKITKATFRKNWRRKDWWLSSDEALRYGFVDEVG